VSPVSCGSLSCGASKEHTASIFSSNRFVHVGGKLMVVRKCVLRGEGFWKFDQSQLRKQKEREAFLP
jgi:hypothetical protein